MGDLTIKLNKAQFFTILKALETAAPEASNFHESASYVLTRQHLVDNNPDIMGKEDWSSHQICYHFSVDTFYNKPHAKN